MEWIDVKVRLPENMPTDGYGYIPCLTYGEYGRIRNAAYNKGTSIHNASFILDFEALDGITHWMPLPEPPKQ